MRVDKGRGVFEKDHVHFKDGSALNSDSTWKHGGKDLTRQESDWLKKIKNIKKNETFFTVLSE